MIQNRIKTGITGLDEILIGGLVPQRSYLVRGGPGTGKTTVGAHFLKEGIDNDEKSLFITLTETKDKIIEDAVSRDLDISRAKFIDLSPGSDFIAEDKEYDVFPADQVEEKPMIDRILEAIKGIEPDRIFFDGIIQLKYLSTDDFKFRKKLLSFLQFNLDYGATILLSSEESQDISDDDLKFLVDGVINLDFNYETKKRQLAISKFRGSDFKNGYHTYKHTGQGIKVFPELSTDKKVSPNKGQHFSGLKELDNLLNGGIETGTVTVLTGPSGVGKTTLGSQFIQKASENNLKTIFYTFEENREVILDRSEAINIPLKKEVAGGKLVIKELDPLDCLPAEFLQDVRQQVENKGAEVIMIDSISSYKLAFNNSTRDNDKILKSIHSLASFLKKMGVTLIITNELKNITGTFKVTDHNISHLADNIIFLRYIEKRGNMIKVIGVLKKRLSGFENTLREFEITSEGIKVGKPLNDLRNILSGTPELLPTTEGE